MNVLANFYNPVGSIFGPALATGGGGGPSTGGRSAGSNSGPSTSDVGRGWGAGASFGAAKANAGLAASKCFPNEPCAATGRCTSPAKSSLDDCVDVAMIGNRPIGSLPSPARVHNFFQLIAFGVTLVIGCVTVGAVDAAIGAQWGEARSLGASIVVGKGGVILGCAAGVVGVLSTNDPIGRG